MAKRDKKFLLISLPSTTWSLPVPTDGSIEKFLKRNVYGLLFKRCGQFSASFSMTPEGRGKQFCFDRPNRAYI